MRWASGARGLLTAALAAMAALDLSACGSDSTVPHTPARISIVSGANQSGGVGLPLDSALVVQVQDGAGKGVSNTAVTWTVSGGGSLSQTSTTTDGDGKASVRWTLAPTVGTQVATASLSGVAGVSVAFVATNGNSISGTVSTIAVNAFGPTFSRVSRGVSLSASSLNSRPLRTSHNIIVGFKSTTVGLSAQASAYRSAATARAATTRLKATLDAALAGRAVRQVAISPAILAARVTVSDTSQVDATIRALQADPSIAYAERDRVLSIHDGAPAPTLANNLARGPRAFKPQPQAGVLMPNYGLYYVQTWEANMIDLPKAWAITTGSTNVTVSVIDMGVQFSHPSMRNLTSDGYDFVTPFVFDEPEAFCDGGQLLDTGGDGDGPDADPTDPDDIDWDDADSCWTHTTLGDHGLWTAGIIGAADADQSAVSGVAWNVKLRPIRVLDITGTGEYFDIAQGVLYAAGLPAVGANGAMVQTTASPIINMSLGGTGDNAVLRDAVAAAVSAGSLIVASTGNDGGDDLQPIYPAGYPGVVAVTSVGMDGNLATYAHTGANTSLAAPGGDFRLDDNGGGGVLGPGWNFVTGKPTLLFGYGTSGAAPYVSGVAALLLAQTPSLTADQLRTRLQTYATRPPNTSRSEMFGWGIVNAYNALEQRNGPARSSLVRLIDANTGAVVGTTRVGNNGTFAFSKLPVGAYVAQAGEDEDADGIIGTPGRRLTWAGTGGLPTTFTVNNNASTTAITLGLPVESEPNNDMITANPIAVNSYVIGSIVSPDLVDMYVVHVPVTGVYRFETSGVLGTCGWGLELDTYLSVVSSSEALVGTNDDFVSLTSDVCSQVTQLLQPGAYYVTVGASAANGLTHQGRYRLEVKLMQ